MLSLPLSCLLLQRRCYWLLEESQAHIVLVHYLNCPTKGAAEQQAVAGRRANRRRAARSSQQQQQQQQAQHGAATGGDGSSAADAEMVDLWGSGASGGLDGNGGGSMPDLASAAAVELPSLSTGLPLPLAPQYGLPSLQQQYALAAAAVREQQRQLLAVQPLTPQQQQGQEAGFAFLQQLTQWLEQPPTAQQVAQQAQQAQQAGPALSDGEIFGTDVPVRDATVAVAEAAAGPGPGAALIAGPQYRRQRSGIIPQVRHWARWLPVLQGPGTRTIEIQADQRFH